MHKVCLDVCVTSVVADRVEFDKMLWIVMYIWAAGQWPAIFRMLIVCLYVMLYHEYSNH